MNDNRLFRIIVDNANLNIDCGYAVLSNAILKAKTREGYCRNLVQAVKIVELDSDYEKRSKELIQKLYEKKKNYSDEANLIISTLRTKSKEEKKKLIKDIDSATERLRNANESVRLSKMKLDSNVEIPDIDPQLISYNEKLQEQLQRAKEKIEKKRKKKSQWESTLAELANIEKNPSSNFIRHKQQKNDFQKIINS